MQLRVDVGLGDREDGDMKKMKSAPRQKRKDHGELIHYRVLRARRLCWGWFVGVVRF